MADETKDEGTFGTGIRLGKNTRGIIIGNQIEGARISIDIGDGSEADIRANIIRSRQKRDEEKK